MKALFDNIEALEDAIAKSNVLSRRELIDIKIRRCLEAIDKLIMKGERSREIIMLRSFFVGFCDVLDTIDDENIPTIGTKYLQSIKKLAERLKVREEVAEDHKKDVLSLMDELIKKWKDIKDTILVFTIEKEMKNLPFSEFVEEFNEPRKLISTISALIRSEINMREAFAFTYLSDTYPSLINQYITEIIKTDDVNMKFNYANEIELILEDWKKNYEIYPSLSIDVAQTISQELVEKFKLPQAIPTRPEYTPKGENIYKFLTIVSKARSEEDAKAFNFNRKNVAKQMGVSVSVLGNIVSYCLENRFIKTFKVGRREYFYITQEGMEELKRMEGVKK